jgi:hypothetical protein
MINEKMSIVPKKVRALATNCAELFALGQANGAPREKTAVIAIAIPKYAQNDFEYQEKIE